MKKHDLLKAIGIAFLIAVILSWVIPTGSFSSTTFTSDGTVPVGIINIFRLPVMTIQTFIQYFLVLLAIGGFYGILNKPGVYDNIVNGIAKKWRGKEKIALIVITVVFALVASLTGLSMLLFVVVPFIAAILLVLGYDKITVLLSTIGAILVGEAGSIFGFSGAGYVKNIFNIEMTDEVITKIILFVLLTGLFTFFVVKRAKLTKVESKKVETKEPKKAVKAVKGAKKATKTTKEAKVAEPVKEVKEPKISIPFLYEDTKNDRSVLPLVISCVLLFALCLVGMYNWYYAFGIQAFNNFHTALANIKIGDYAIVTNILNGVSSLGYWGNYELSVALIMGSVVIGWLYNVSVSDFIEGYKKGVKDMFMVAFYATICNVVFTIMLSNSGNMYSTIINWLGGFAKSFSLPIVTLISMVGSLFYNDFYYLLTDASGILSSYDAVYYPIMGVVTTAIPSIAMMILPTSVMLVVGLKYFDISYKDWFKAIWKYLLEAFVIVIIVAIIVAVLV